MKRNRFAGWLAALAAATMLGLVGCSASEATAPPANVSVSGQSKAQGANAAPQAERATAPADSSALPYDTSQSAMDAFASWWNYEIQVAEDNKPAERIYEAGVTVCLARAKGAGTDTILTVLHRDLGYTKAGAAGIYKSALQTLCKQYDLGYQTYFDHNAEKFRTEVAKRVNYNVGQPDVFAYGFFMKEACAAMSAPGIGGSRVFDHMRTQTQLVLMENGKVGDDVLRVYINRAVSAGCEAVYTQLPPVIQMSA